MLTPEKKEKLLKAAEEEVRAIKSDAPPPLILSLDDFRGLANAFPALVLRYKPTLAPYILLFDAWEANTRAVTRTFVPGDNFEATRAALMAYCDFSKIPEEAVLPIQGAAGVGKTRTVYECMKSLPAARNTVLYTDDEERAAELSIILANDSRARAILVGDECSLSFRAQIANALRGHTDRVRCICIESSTDHLSMQAPELTLDKLPETAVERILEANFPNVSADRRRAYSALSEGFIRLAADSVVSTRRLYQRGVLVQH